MKVNYLLRMMVAVALMFTVATVKAADHTAANQAELVALVNPDTGTAENGDVITLTNSIEITGGQIVVARRVTIKGGDGIEIKAGAGYINRLLQVQPGNDAVEKLVFENITFRDAYNDATGETDGGVGRIANGTVEFNNCKFIDNYAYGRAGVWDIYGGNVFFTDCLFEGNGSRGRAGAIMTRSDGTRATFNNCKFVGNYSTNDKGGAVNLQSVSAQYFYNCIFTENYAGTVVDPTDWTKNVGGGASVFALNGAATLYVEGCAIYGNFVYNDHGGILQTDNSPTMTFVNTTIADNIMYRDANSMFFITGGTHSPKLNFFNVTYVNNNAYVAQAGDPPGKQGPNNGNSTGIRFESSTSKFTIHNSILVGNMSRGTGLVPVDIMLQGTSNNAANIPVIFEIKNSFVGNIKGSAVNPAVLATIPGASTSVLNFTPETAEGMDSDLTGINWTKGLVTAANGQAYYELLPGSQAVTKGDPALLTAVIGSPLVDQIGTARDGASISAGAIEFVAVPETCLDLDNLTLGADKYDAATRTITYTGAWQFVGWEWAAGEDFSDYNYLEVNFDLGGITGATDVEFCISYIGGNGDGDYIVKPTVKAGMQKVIIPIGKGNRGMVGGSAAFVPEFNTDASKVWKIGTKNAGSGTIVLGSLCFGYRTPLTYSLDELNFFATDSGEDATASSYDPATTTVTYNKGWARAGWNFEPDGGLNVSQYNQIFLVLDNDNISLFNGETPVALADAKIQFDVEYMDGSKETSTTNQYGNEYRANAETLMWNLIKAKSQKIKLITLKSQYTGTIKLKDAFLFLKDIDPVDLVVTSIRTEPVKPAPGEATKMFATIKNIHPEFASPEGEKHGVVFTINGTTVAWCDNFFDSLQPGEEVELEANGGPGAGNTGTWTPGNDFSYSFRAQVNDSKNIVEEVDGEPAYDNNFSEIETIYIEGTVDLEIIGIQMDWDDLGYLDNPRPGDEIVFKARVKNIGTLNSPKGIKHGVAFKVNNSVVSWSDTHFESIPNTGQITTLTANGGPNGGNGTWTPTQAGTFTVLAEVNDQKEIPESNYINNTFTIDVIIVNIEFIAGDESYVYVENGTLYIVGYAADAVVDIFSLTGQKVATVVNGQSIQLNKGAYLVQVTEKGKGSVQKVLVK
jgi:hypothetical protein